jgi:rare lipoprotein A
MTLLIAQGCSTVSAPMSPSVISKPDTVETPSATPTAPVLPVRVGQASWYGPGFSGRKTASGDLFDEEKFTAAHKTIALGSRAKVTNLANGKSVEVEINDRGPFVQGRIIDLSQAAAQALGIIDRGTARVRVDVLSDGVSVKP